MIYSRTKMRRTSITFSSLSHFLCTVGIISSKVQYKWRLTHSCECSVRGRVQCRLRTTSCTQTTRSAMPDPVLFPTRGTIIENLNQRADSTTSLRFESSNSHLPSRPNRRQWLFALPLPSRNLKSLKPEWTNQRETRVKTNYHLKKKRTQYHSSPRVPKIAHGTGMSTL